MIKGFHFHVTDSFANGPCCADVVRIATALQDGSTMDVDCVLVYAVLVHTVDDEGGIASLRAHWDSSGRWRPSPGRPDPSGAGLIRVAPA